MTEKFVMPGRVSYYLPGGTPVYYIDAKHKAPRTVPGDIRTFILHETDGIDSRQELYDSARKVSVHYLIGAYPDTNGPVCIKYASERTEKTFGAGFGTVGGIKHNLNETCISFEIESRGMTDATLDAYANCIAHSLHNWATRTQVPVLLPHWLVDARKTDPKFQWTGMLSRIYRIYESLPTQK